MYISKVGKLEIRAIVLDFEKTLIEKFGMNMLDAAITRADAVNAFNETGCPHQAAELCAARLGLKPESTSL